VVPTAIAEIAIDTDPCAWWDSSMTTTHHQQQSDTAPISVDLDSPLDMIDLALTDNIARSHEIQRRVRLLKSQLANGTSLEDLVNAEESPRTVELISANLAILEGVGSDFRLSLAQALRREGLTIEAVAALFGVTRQRISALLRQGSS